jgi:hypothetical protein
MANSESELFFLNKEIYIKNKQNFTDDITEEFTFNSVELHLLALVQLWVNLSSLSFFHVLEVTKWLLKAVTSNSQRRGSSLLLLPPHYCKIYTYFCLIFCHDYPIILNKSSNFKNPSCTPSSKLAVFTISFPSVSREMFNIRRR